MLNELDIREFGYTGKRMILFAMTVLLLVGLTVYPLHTYD